MNKRIYWLIGISCVFICSFAYDKQDKELQESMRRGKEVYLTNCVTCHMSEGQGVTGVFPPLANSDYMMADQERTVDVIINGISGEMVVNNVTYNGAMAGYPISDKELADLLNYIQNSWGNEADYISTEEAKALRKN